MILQNFPKNGVNPSDFTKFANNSVFKKSDIKMSNKKTVDSKVSRLTVQILRRREGVKITNSLIAKKLGVSNMLISDLLKGQERINVVTENKLKKYYPFAFKLAQEEIKLSADDIFDRLTANKMSLENSLEIRKVINDLFWKGDPWKAAGKTKNDFIQEELNTYVTRVNAMLSPDQKKMQMQLKSIKKYYLASPQLALAIRPILQKEHKILTEEDKPDTDKILDAIKGMGGINNIKDSEKLVFIEKFIKQDLQNERSRSYDYALSFIKDLLIRVLSGEEIREEILRGLIDKIEADKSN